MRASFLLFFITLYSSITYADDIDKQINNACQRHAVSLVAQLKADVIANMNQEQSDQALKIATTSCQAYFSKTFSNKTLATDVEVATSGTSEESKSGSSSILDIFDSEVKRKPGNERLNKRRY